MKVYNYPLVSIITVNYNGKRFLTSLFDSIKDIDYPPDKMQTILVDNASTDGSVETVKKNFPWVDTFCLDKNHGYAGGNNAGLKRADGEYAALINNDCIVDKGWLKGLVETAVKQNSDGRTGAVCSKVLFYYDYIPVRFEFENSPGRLYLEIRSFKTEAGPSINEDLSGYIRLLDCSPGGTAVNYTKGTGLNLNPGMIMALPVPEHNKHILVECSLSASKKTDLRIVIDKPGSPGNPQEKTAGELFSGIIGAGGKILNLRIEKESIVLKKGLINSCGLEISKKFYARDRGSNCWDKDQFDAVEEVFSPSGSSLLVNIKMLEETGYFDDSFFTYYEDLDLFWRARLRGWKHYFSPYSVARHHHCGTGTEWSYSFSYHVIRNRLLTIFKCGWFTEFLRSYFSFVASSISSTFFYILSSIRGRKQNRPDIRARIRIFFELFYLLPKNLGKRIRVRNSASLQDSEIKRWTLDF